jgi:pyridoxine kinase
MSAGGPPEAVLSIQSQVVSGHVGNSAATLPLQRLGFDVFPVPTVLLAHHPGQGRGWRGHKVEPARIAEILSGLEDRGALARCAAVLSGYLGAPEVADLVLHAVGAVRTARPDALYLCDPVIGDDHTGVFVAPGVAEAIQGRLLAAADIVTPNRFELAHLSGRPVHNLDDALAATEILRKIGPRLVVVTGLELPDAPDTIGLLADCADAAWLVTTPRLPGIVHGTGDVFSALLLGHHLRSGAPELALELASAAIFAVVERTHAAGADELQLVATQDELAAPKARFRPRRLR